MSCLLYEGPMCISICWPRLSQYVVADRVPSLGNYYLCGYLTPRDCSVGGGEKGYNGKQDLGFLFVVRECQLACVYGVCRRYRNAFFHFILPPLLPPLGVLSLLSVEPIRRPHPADEACFRGARTRLHIQPSAPSVIPRCSSVPNIRYVGRVTSSLGRNPSAGGGGMMDSDFFFFFKKKKKKKKNLLPAHALPDPLFVACREAYPTVRECLPHAAASLLSVPANIICGVAHATRWRRPGERACIVAFTT
ncbi:hypothetical protein B0T26DRAFT_414415 [Lasiosphaeria miniovina]|uniref:Uncharacterized protein n=1 Tax=Lasiosphaeria miniovina TaxID=1954250 RepID=A0AA40DNF6_9PEZI|nr:uncharacterized protein B0T26DRAFT_414415 [Lasiosphaeria miniovina]KAK0709625.1 hypothetical protein B0T26DRAFT_414415 [Lasiosphaeria miniovina]